MAIVRLYNLGFEQGGRWCSQRREEVIDQSRCAGLCISESEDSLAPDVFLGTLVRNSMDTKNRRMMHSLQATSATSAEVWKQSRRSSFGKFWAGSRLLSNVESQEGLAFLPGASWAACVLCCSDLLGRETSVQHVQREWIPCCVVHV